MNTVILSCIGFYGNTKPGGGRKEEGQVLEGFLHLMLTISKHLSVPGNVIRK
jgi:hypothetical protein